jgi:predicted nucleic acid-binding protein
MTERLVVDTGPLVVLARAELLHVVESLLLDIVCPVEVQRELLAGAATGCLRTLPTWLTVLELSAPLHPIANASLDAGEAAVIQLALEREISRVCLDDRKGRRAARAVGLQVTGSLGLLARAKVLGLVPEVRPLVMRLVQAGGYYHEDLVRRLLEGLGESESQG